MKMITLRTYATWMTGSFLWKQSSRAASYVRAHGIPSAPHIAMYVYYAGIVMVRRPTHGGGNQATASVGSKLALVTALFLEPSLDCASTKDLVASLQPMRLAPVFRLGLIPKG